MADYTGKENFFTGMQDTNFEITSDELKAMQDTSFYKIKWQVTDKISTLFTGLQSEIEANINNINNLMPQHVFSRPGKISKGENYLGFPYLVMDFPRIFEKDNVFAFRTMFWWGHHFSYTLHVGGTYYENTKMNFINRFDLLRHPDIYICVHTDPWAYHYLETNFKPATSFNPHTFIDSRPSSQNFIKLSFRTDFHAWGSVKKDGLSAFQLFCNVLYGNS